MGCRLNQAQELWPCSGRLFDKTDATEIEHILARFVSPSEAHSSGVCRADAVTRERFASDLINLTLAALLARTNLLSWPGTDKLSTNA